MPYPLHRFSSAKAQTRAEQCLSRRLIDREPICARSGLRLSGLLLAVGLCPLAQADEATGDTQLQTVTVTSSKTAEKARSNLRTVVDSATPIDIINSEQLLKTGRAELSEAISKLLPSFNFGTNIAGYQSTVRPLNNRSLNPAYTVVLVNGKRRHNGSVPASGSTDNSGHNPVDIDMIPISAVERIEVLKDGAAARYGADGIAGVINIILRSDPYGTHVGTSYGQLYSGQGETAKFEGNTGFALGDGGFLQISLDARKRGQAYWLDKADSGYRAYFEDDRQAAWDHRALKNGDPKLKAYNWAYNAELPFSDALKLYSYGTYGERRARVQNNFRLPNSNASIPELFPDGYFPLNNIEDTDYQVLIGGKGALNAWDWDLSTTYGRNRNSHSSDLTINPSYGPESPTSFDDLATFQFEQLSTNFDLRRTFEAIPLLSFPVEMAMGLENRWERFRTFDGDPLAYTVGPYTYPQYLADGSPNPLYAAYGGRTAIGAQAAVTIRPENEADQQRNTTSAYLSFVFKPTKRWDIGIAGRLEHYDDMPENENFSFNLTSRYELTDTLAVRGNVGTGYRAPSLTQIGYSVTDNRTAVDADGNVVPALRRTVTPNNALAKALGGGDLESERTKNLGLGLTWQPAPRTSVTLDAYVIDIDDRIMLSENLYDRQAGNGAFGDVLASQGFARTDWISFYTNAFDTRTRGVDLVADHWTPFGRFGDVRWTLAFNWNNTTIRGRASSTPAALQSQGIELIGHASEGTLVSASPHTKLILGANWTLGNLAVNLLNTRYGSVETWQQNETQDRSFGAKWLTDLDISYTLFNSLTLSLGGTNIFDVRPDKNGIDNPNGGQAVYGNPPFHPAGGAWYTKLAYDF